LVARFERAIQDPTGAPAMAGRPIHILDEIEFAPGRRAAFLAALEKRYRPQAEALGLRLRSVLLEPPIEVAGVAARAWIGWELDGIAAFWSWRARGTAQPDLAAFWSDAAPQIARRVRRYAGAGSLESAGLEPAATASSAGAARPDPALPRSVCLLTLRPGVEDGERAELERALAAAPGGAFASLGRNLPGTLSGGDYTWDVAGASAGDLIDGLAAPLRALLVDRDEVVLEPIAGGVRAPEITNPIKRTLFLRVRADASPAAVAEFERVLLLMPAYIGAIRNWCLSRAHGPRGWTHVWEQDFADPSGLSDDYMNHPIHWSVVDPWFHPEDPRCIAAPELAHVFCRSLRSVLSHTLTRHVP
jgi:Stress responsive A/B Barrel Domain